MLSVRLNANAHCKHHSLILLAPLTHTAPSTHSTRSSHSFRSLLSLIPLARLTLSARSTHSFHSLAPLAHSACGDFEDLQNAFEELKSNATFARRVVRVDGRALKHLMRTLQTKQDLVLEAIRQNVAALKFAAYTLGARRSVLTAYTGRGRGDRSRAQKFRKLAACLRCVEI